MDCRQAYLLIGAHIAGDEEVTGGDGPGHGVTQVTGIKGQKNFAVAGRAGSALTAEIGLMKATEQLSSMEMMAVDPLRRVIAPRFWAGFISMPLLASIFSMVGILGAHLVGVDWLGVDGGTFWSVMQSQVDFQGDIVNGMIKSIVFAFVVTWISIYKGFDCEPTSEGISKATTSTVVQSSLMVLALDFILTALMFTN